MEASGIRIITYGNKEAEFSLWDVADIHLLNRGCSKNHLIKDINAIRNDPYSLFFIGGDYADWIYPGDKRFDPEAFDADFRINDITKLGLRVHDMMVEYFQPIQTKCLGLLIGNHEFTAMNRNSQTFVHEMICESLSVPNMRYSGFVDLYFVHKKNSQVRVTYSDQPPEYYTSRLRVFIHHGSGAANTAGGKINRLKSFVDLVDVDLVMMGHVHDQISKAFPRLVPNGNCSDFGEKVTMGMITGSYLRTYAKGFTGYGEMKGYQTATLGASRARYRPQSCQITVESRANNVGTRGDL